MPKRKLKTIVPKRVTRFVGETKIDKLNKEALKIARAIKGSFG